ncbi:hypothetical protein DUNSADRAFT_7259 [Dunaliella salina]|uniref:Encoded protein n=1 Tax=Dunaliella salina TaxID=3046 RepID=A0ABQ7GLN9_DUNSA|nr:hypothetical protein DUNSADRAFT_7259 [Dunaliella salina]|eukprot:KAF5835520.1 hypothetical protein DUNSADRAFT_7259 [Dunaliella salina]
MSTCSLHTSQALKHSPCSCAHHSRPSSKAVKTNATIRYVTSAHFPHPPHLQCWGCLPHYAQDRAQAMRSSVLAATLHRRF